MALKYFPIGATITLSVSSCAADVRRECDLPPLSDQKIMTIANAYLVTQKMNPKFREIAEKRVRAVGCRYEYEEAEKIDSFGVGVIVVVDRNGKVVEFRGSN
ncbi:MAG: hypothetical protein U1F22_07740 [Lysobacterales bacterium]